MTIGWEPATPAKTPLTQPTPTQARRRQHEGGRDPPADPGRGSGNDHVHVQQGHQEEVLLRGGGRGKKEQIVAK